MPIVPEFVTKFVATAKEGRRHTDAVMRAKNVWRKHGIQIPKDTGQRELTLANWNYGDRPQVRIHNTDDSKADSTTYDRASVYLDYSPASKDQDERVTDGEMVRVTRKVIDKFREQEAEVSLTVQEGKKPLVRIRLVSRPELPDQGEGITEQEKYFDPEDEGFFQTLRSRFDNVPRLVESLFPDEHGALDVEATLKAMSNPKLDTNKPSTLLRLVVKK